MRLCDGCGIKVPRFRPRTNQNGRMLCDGCAEGKPGGEGRPIGYHGIRRNPSFPGHKTAIDLGTGARLNVSDCKRCGHAIAWKKSKADKWYPCTVVAKQSMEYGSDIDVLRVRSWEPHRCEDTVISGKKTFTSTVLASKTASVDGDFARWLDENYGNLGQLFLEDEGDFWSIVSEHDDETQDAINNAYAERSRMLYGGSRKTAHDSGDGETIYHCPFCGGGQVTGGSDGSVECGFCHTLFTVQVQPEHAATPQTINGVPQQVPGMPGEVGGAPNPVGAPPPGGDTGTDAFVPPDAFAPPEKPGVPPVAARLATTGEPEAATKACDHFKPGGTDGDGNEDPNTCSNCFWTIGAHDAKAGGTSPVGEMPKTTRFYINANGVALPEDSYIRHLAIAFADDPAAVIEQVREERAG